MSVVRELFSSHINLDQKSAVRRLALAYGHQRAGKNVQSEMLSHLRIAVRRGIIENNKGSYSLLCKSIDGYDRAFLKSQLIASLPRRWISREEAIQQFARWLGFRRTGKKIVELTRSLIIGGLRTGHIQKNAAGEIKRV